MNIRLIGGLVGFALSLCAVAQTQEMGEQPKYSVSYTDTGFILETEESEYQFIPAKDKLEKLCIATAKQAAESAAEKQGRSINQLKYQDIKLEFSRSPWTGISKCNAKVSAQWKQLLLPL